MRKIVGTLLALVLLCALGIGAQTAVNGVYLLSNSMVYVVGGTGAIYLGTQVGYGSGTLGTTSVSSGNCSTAVTIAVAGAATTDRVIVSYASSPTGVADKGLFLEAYPTAGNVNVVQCNATASSITPSGLGFNYSVVR